MKNNYLYNPVFSFIRYLILKLSGRIGYPENNIGGMHTLKDSHDYKIFLEIDILDEHGQPKRGGAVFKIIFNSPRLDPAYVKKRTKFTIPFFTGLHGFCTKQFMVNEKLAKFSGRYEWETVEAAQNYAHSFAVTYMKRRSAPHPISYEIIDLKKNELVEEYNSQNAEGVH